MRYKCQLCEYETNSKFQIHYHHIEPREVGGSNKKWNMIWLCPNCHSRVYIPVEGIKAHNIKADNSIVLLRWVRSTGGVLLEYIDEHGELQYKEKR